MLMTIMWSSSEQCLQSTGLCKPNPSARAAPKAACPAPSRPSHLPHIVSNPQSPCSAPSLSQGTSLLTLSLEPFTLCGPVNLKSILSIPRNFFHYASQKFLSMSISKQIKKYRPPYQRGCGVHSGRGVHQRSHREHSREIPLKAKNRTAPCLFHCVWFRCFQVTGFSSILPTRTFNDLA